MTHQRCASIALALLLAAPVALAMSSGPTPPPDRPGMSGPDDRRPSPRQEAEESYALAYEEVARARREAEQGKPEKAAKRYARARERCERAVTLDMRYHEAWNLLGYAARKLGDYEKSVKAYERCLVIKPDYAPAREYLGEAWLEQGDLRKAREQLTWLERLGAAEEAKTLRAALEAWATAHPDIAAAPAPPPTRPDSAAAPGTSGRP